MSERIAIVRVRGLHHIRHDIDNTLNILHLRRKHSCAVVEKNPTTIGMVRKIKDYVTFGEVNDDVYNILVEKRGQLYKGRIDPKGKIGNKFIVINNKNYKPFFRLSPPKKGFEREGLKMSFRQGGVLGDRGEKINDLLMRMV
ncbi:MAG: uL30 family ribosomal protein [Candidatus Woesearchaeota archaeon]